MYRASKRFMQRALALVLVAVIASGCSSGGVREGGNPERALETHIQLVMGYIENGNRESARHHLRRAEDIDSRAPEVMAARALVFQMEGEKELAEEAFQRSLRRDSDFTQARYNYGAFLYREERYEEAFEQFERASRDLDYDHRGQVLLSLGRTARVLERPERAKSALTHALRINSDLSAAMIELAELHFERENYAEAKRYLDMHSELNRQSPRSLLLGIKIERIFGNEDREASYALALENLYPYSQEHLEYQRMLAGEESE